MKKARKFLNIFMLFAAAFLMWAVIAPQNAKAASKSANGVITMEYSKDDVYSGADITGDKKKDTIKKTITQSGNTYGAILYVNGKKVKTWKSLLPNVRIITVNKTSYLEIITEVAMGNTSCGLYQVKNGKLTKILDYSTLVNKKLLVKEQFIYTGDSWDMIWTDSVSGNTMTMSMSVGTKSLGQIKIRGLKITCKNGKFSLATKSAPAAASIITKTGVIQTFTAKSSLTVYKSAGSSAAAFTMKKNTKFTVSAAAVKNKNIYVYIKTSAGKKGWLKMSSSGNAFVKQTAIVIWG